MNEGKDKKYTYCKLIASYVYFTCALTTSHIDSTSRHFAVVLNIPIQNISIYFTKLYSLRCLLNGVGLLTEYLIYISLKRVGNPRNNRRYLSISIHCLYLVVKITLILILHCSSHLAYHIYIILAIEGLFCGSTMSLLAIAPEHLAAMLLGFNIGRLFSPSIQFILDIFWYKRPMFTIKIQAWLSVILTAIGVVLWIYYSQNKNCTSESDDSTTNGSNSVNKNDIVEIATFSETMEKAISPFLMFPAGSIFKDFLYPGVLPYAVLQRDKCHIINLLSMIVYSFGPLSFFVLERVGFFEEWNHYYDAFWILPIPIALISIYTLMAIHSRIPSAMKIRNSKPIVLIMTVSVVTYHSYMYALSFDGLGKVIQKGFKNANKKGDVAVITLSSNLAQIERFIISKFSVGYNDTRVSLGYHLPRFRPNHRMSKSNTLWYIFRNTFSRAGRDTINDFKMNIKDYL